MFIQNYYKIICNHIGTECFNNFDKKRFLNKPKLSFSNIIFSAFVSIASRFGITTIKYAQNDIIKATDFISHFLSELEWLYSKLADDESRDILVRILAFRALGFKKIRLPINNPAYWQGLKNAESLVVGHEDLATGFMNLKLQKMNLKPLGYPIEIFFSPSGVLIDFIQQQYRCETPNGSIGCSSGDFVIDAGGCWGDTALYFAHHCGPTGRVYSFEFLPENLAIYKRNLEINPELQSRVELIENPIWSKAGEEMAVNANGPGTRLKPGEIGSGKMKFRTESIDHLLESGRISKVDFIKMDIEGAELPALKGAEKTVRLYKPKLAITVYHSINDFWEIPMYLNSLNLGYRFYLRHFTIHAEETVLFAQVKQN